MMSLNIDCASCRNPLSFAPGVVQTDYLGGIVGVRCRACDEHAFACRICVKSWTDGSNNSKHLKGKRHKQLVLHNQAVREETIRVNQSLIDNDDDDGSFPGGGGGELDDMDFGESCPPSSPAVGGEGGVSDDWLTSKCGQLGDSATTLQAIKQSGSFHPDSKSPEFYYFEMQNPGEGAKFLASQPFCTNPADVTNEEAEFHLKITKFLTRMTKADQEELAYILLRVYNARESSLSIFRTTRPPITTKDFNDFYLGRGKSTKAILGNLPTPVVVKTQDQLHAFVSLTDVIQNMLAASTTVDQFHFETDMIPDGENNAIFDDDKPASISKTRAAYSLFIDLQKGEDDEDFVLYLWVKRWCDDFDPNNTKQSRNQVWLMTNTVCPPPGENRGRNTFFMALGQKGDDHQEIDSIFEEELKVLSRTGKTFYHCGRKELNRVKAGTVCVCVDRPERASLYQIGDHTGTFSTMWGYAIDVNGKCEDNCLPSCPFCCCEWLMRWKLDDRTGSDMEHTCSNKECHSWNVMSTRFTCAAPAGFPTKCDPDPSAPKAPAGREILSHVSARNHQLP